MRAIVVLALAAMLFPAAAGAQNEGAKATSADRGGVTKEQYIDRAKQRAAKRFDKLDANHDGVLSSEESHAANRKKPAKE